MKACFLTNNNGVYGLPAGRTFIVTDGGFVAPDGVRMTKADLEQRSTADLRSHGVARFEELGFDETYKVKTGETDQFTAWGVVRTPTTTDKDVEVVRAPVLSQINAVRSGKLNADFEVVIPAGIKTKPEGAETFTALAAPATFVVQRDMVSQLSLFRALFGALAGIMPLDANGDPAAPGAGTHVAWRMRDNTNVLLSAPQFIQYIGVAEGLNWSAIFKASWDIKREVEQLELEGLKAFQPAQAEEWPTVAAPE